MTLYRYTAHVLAPCGGRWSYAVVGGSYVECLGIALEQVPGDHSVAELVMAARVEVTP